MSATVGVSFDTHKFIKQMVATGFTEEQAETQARLLAEILDTQLSTKVGVAKMDYNVLELKRDIKELDAKIEASKAELKRDIAAIDAKMEATKAELKRDIAAIDAKVETTRVSLQKEIESSKVDTIKWIAGMFAAQTALILGAMFAIMRMNQPPPVVYQPPAAQELRQMTPQPAVPPAR
ncbi:MAG: DUF1640 domain-containing protein [Magnetococcales bacterium]|nr:DUF1640 domain-containing protein [Magnetococcales bacterium]MBF0114397.1 DUF1640 domain-containing protein [Magnetococcales bacterium]